MYQAFQKYQNGFDAMYPTIYARDHCEIPIFAVAVYLMMVFQMPKLLEKRQPFKLRGAIALWNGALSLFSILGSIHLTPHLIKYAWKNGVHESICAHPGDWYRQGAPAFWMTLFIFSKIPELVDTLFLVLQKKKVIFLHWFHHTTVLLYCWHAFHNSVGPGIWFASMNYGVHSVMYAYYCAMALRYRKFASSLAPAITILQITQMVVGTGVTAYSAAVHSSGGECSVDPANYKMGLMMYMSYFSLFCMLFYAKYLSPEAKSAKSKKVGITAHMRDTYGGLKDNSPAKESDDFCGATVRAARSQDAAGGFMGTSLRSLSREGSTVSELEMAPEGAPTKKTK